MIKLIYSNDCEACRTRKPIFEEVVSKYNVEVSQEELNIENLKLFPLVPLKENGLIKRDEKGSVVKFHNVVFPSVFFFDKDGTVLGNVTGIDKDQLEFLIENLYEQ